jgi:NAD(P)-dependent dehydrogenase (short-subunit alcohol dehydrogenase family)
MTSPRALALSLAAAGALVLAGCMGDARERLSKAEYEEKVRSVYAGVQESFRETNVTDQGDLADRVEDAQDELRRAAGELEDVDPPDEVEAENAQIAESMRAYADDLDVLREAAERRDSTAVSDFSSRVASNDAIARMMEAAERMKFKGYDVGDIAEE